MPNRISWHGDEIERRARRATGRAIIAIGENIDADATEFAHVISGTLRRSIHTAPAEYIGFEDHELAMLGWIPNVEDPSWRDDEAVIHVGSWIPYACVEETGRNHKFMQPAVEGMMGPRSDALVQKAFKEEGLA